MEKSRLNWKKNRLNWKESKNLNNYQIKHGNNNYKGIENVKKRPKKDKIFQLFNVLLKFFNWIKKNSLTDLVNWFRLIPKQMP